MVVLMLRRRSREVVGVRILVRALAREACRVVSIAGIVRGDGAGGGRRGAYR